MLAFASATVAGLLTVGSVYLHAVGLVYRGAYLGYFGLSTGQFPATASELMLFGGLALIGQGVSLVVSLATDPQNWLAFGAAYVYVLLLLWAFRLPAPTFAGVPHWLVRALRHVLLPIAIFIGGIFLIGGGAFLPWSLLSPGHYAGRERAQQDVQQVLRSCDACVIAEAEDFRVKGLMVAANSDDIAIFEPQRRLTHVIARTSELALQVPLPSAEDVDPGGSVQGPAASRASMDRTPR